jgi:hypothetical protein
MPYSMVKILRWLTLSLSLALLCSPASAQDTRRLAIKSDRLFADNLGMLYALDGNKLSKYNASGNYCCSYENKRFGKPKIIYTINPLKTLLFYSDYQQLVILSDLLGEIQVIDIGNLGFSAVSVATYSRDQNIWLYDPGAMKLVKVNESGSVLFQSDPLNVSLQKTINPNYLLEAENFLFVNDAEKGIFIFDTYGNYFKTLPIKGLSDFQVIGDELFYFQNGFLRSYNYKSLEEKVYNFSTPTNEPIKDVKIGPSKVYLQGDAWVEVRKF